MDFEQFKQVLPKAQYIEHLEHKIKFLEGLEGNTDYEAIVGLKLLREEYPELVNVFANGIESLRKEMAAYLTDQHEKALADFEKIRAI